MPLLIKVEIIHDKVANVYVATSPDLKGLVVEAETLDELEKEVWDLVPELLTLDMSRLCVKTVTHLSFFSTTCRSMKYGHRKKVYLLP